MLTVHAIVVLCFTSVSLSAPLACEDLIQPLDHVDLLHLEGKWALVAGGVSNPESLEFFKRRNSSSVIFASDKNEAHTYNYTVFVSSGGTCHSQSMNISLEGNTMNFNLYSQMNVTGTFLQTSCADCLLIRYDSEGLLRLYLFRRSRELGQTELEEFKKQVECLKMPPPVVMDPTKSLCPEEPVSKPAASQTEM